MSSQRIGSTPFLELLPDSIAGDPAIRAAADALDGLLVPSVKAIPSLLLYARLYGKEPDLLPPLAVMAAVRSGTTRFVNAARLRMKESDRLTAVADVLATSVGRTMVSGAALPAA